MKEKRLTKKLLALMAVVLLIACVCQTAMAGRLVLEDPLTATKTGQYRSGGSFVADGWKITNRADYVYWHLPYPVSKGAVEFSVKGLNPNECRTGLTDKSEIFHMYDWTFNNADTNYGGYRDNPFKHFIRKQGCAYAYNNKIDSMELVLVIGPNYQEPDTQNLSWSSSTTYLFREEWGPDGNGNCVFKTYRNGVQVMTMTEPGSWSPSGHSVKIGMARMDEWSGAPLDAIFSNLKVWDTSDFPPLAPVVSQPANGETIKGPLAFIKWNS